MSSNPKKRARVVTTSAIPEDVFKITYFSDMENFTPGSIMQVKFYKFMCYDNEQTPFILNLKPNLTVIHGQNGSGKSTIVDALQFCFGVTASQTDRASKLGEFVSHGHTKGAASVILCNKLSSEGGFSPYYEDVFGSYILIGREATRSGQVTYRFDSEYVSLVDKDLLVRKKDSKAIEASVGKYNNYIRSSAELTYREAWKKIVDDICNHYSIQITNPLLVLKQNMAKTFINGSDKEKYEFLQQVMKTEKIESEINKAAEELIDCENDLKEVEEILMQIIHEVNNKQMLVQKVKDAGGQDLLNKQVTNAMNRMKKANYLVKNREIEELKKKIENIKGLQKELAEKMNKDEEESKERENKAQSIVRLCNEAQYKSDTINSEKKRISNEIAAHKRRYQDNIKDLDRNILILERNIKEKKSEMRKLQSQSSNTKEIADRIVKLEKEIDELDNKKTSTSEELNQKEEKYRIQKALSDKCVKELTQLQTEMNQLKNKERDISEIINKTPQDKIQEASKALSGKIKGKIIWPVSAYVRVKPEYEQYTALIETKMKSCLDSAVISDNDDRPLIRSICQERKIPEPNITSIPGTNSDEVQTNYYQDTTYDIISFLDTLDFSALDAHHRAILKIYFSDVMKFDQILLCSDDLKAETFLKNQGLLQGKKNNVYLFPQAKQIDGMNKRFKEILTLREKKLTSTFGDLQSQYSAIHQAVTMLNQQKGANLEECKRQQKEIKEQLIVKQKDYNEKKEERYRIANTLTEFERSIDASKDTLRQTIRKLEDRISEKNECEDQLKEAQQGSGSKVDELDAQITDKENDLNRVRQQLEEQKNRQENDAELIEMDKRKTELGKEYESFQNEINEYRNQIQELQDQNAAYNKVLEEDEGKKKSLMIKLTNHQQDIDRLRRENANYEAYKNVNVDGGEIRSPDEEQKEYDLLKKKLDQIRNDGLPTLQEAEAELDKVQMRQIELEAKYRQNLDIKNDLQLQIDPRKHDLLTIRDAVADACQVKMIEYMMKFRSAATVTIDWDERTVQLEIQARADESEDNSTKDINQLSGGEKTRTTLCFFLSLLDQIKTPFLVMDEIDVFMDDYSRNKSYELILEVAGKSKRQMILLTPKEIDQEKLKNSLINLERKSLI